MNPVWCCWSTGKSDGLHDGGDVMIAVIYGILIFMLEKLWYMPLIAVKQPEYRFRVRTFAAVRFTNRSSSARMIRTSNASATE